MRRFRDDRRATSGRIPCRIFSSGFCPERTADGKRITQVFRENFVCRGIVPRFPAPVYACRRVPVRRAGSRGHILCAAGLCRKRSLPPAWNSNGIFRHLSAPADAESRQHFLCRSDDLLTDCRALSGIRFRSGIWHNSPRRPALTPG